MIYWLLMVVVVLSYFLGNISFARLMSRKNHVDITTKGSGNPGATNVFRNVGHKTGYIVLLLDVLKGAVPSLVAYGVFGFGTIEGLIALYACGLAVMIGHLFPVFYRFRGGKAAATMIGVFLVAQPIPMLVLFVLAFVFVWFFKYLSLASLLIVTIMVIWQNLTLSEPNLVISLLTFAMFLLVWFAHRSNIERLLKGKETKTNIKKKIEKEQKVQQKIDKKIEEKAEKVEVKIEKEEQKAEIKEAKQELKQEIKEAKQDIKEEKKQIKQVKKSTKTTKKKQKKATKKTKKQKRKAK